MKTTKKAMFLTQAGFFLSCVFVTGSLAKLRLSHIKRDHLHPHRIALRLPRSGTVSSYSTHHASYQRRLQHSVGTLFKAVHISPKTHTESSTAKIRIAKLKRKLKTLLQNPVLLTAFPQHAKRLENPIDTLQFVARIEPRFLEKRHGLLVLKALDGLSKPPTVARIPSSTAMAKALEQTVFAAYKLLQKSPVSNLPQEKAFKKKVLIKA